MNPELTYTLPAYQTACGAADIMMHVMERYFVTEDTLALTDGMAEALIRTVMENAPIALKEPENYKARAEILWACVGQLGPVRLRGEAPALCPVCPPHLRHPLPGRRQGDSPKGH